MTLFMNRLNTDAVRNIKLKKKSLAFIISSKYIDERIKENSKKKLIVILNSILVPRSARNKTSVQQNLAIESISISVIMLSEMN